MAKPKRKSNIKTKFWEDKFLPKLKKHHGNRSKGVFHRLIKKSSTLITSL